MVNDTNTLNGSLSQLGETLASNITAKGVSASASDGLTTLANKVLQITGGGSTTLFEDTCSSASGLSNYGSSVLVRGSTATMTMEYDSNENAYKVSGSGNYHAMIPIPTLDDVDEYTITAEFKGQNIQYNCIGFFLDNRNDTTSYGLDYGLQVWHKRFHSGLYSVSSDGGESNVTVSSLNDTTWYKITFEVDGNTLTGTLYDDGGNQLATKTRTQSISNKQMGIFLFCEKGTTQSACWVKNIKAESNSAPYSPCAEYIAEIDSAIEYINGDGS